MKEIKVYEFNRKDLIFNSIFTLAQIILVLWAIFKLYPYPFIIPFVILLPAIFLRFQVYEMYMTLQFTKYDAGNTLVINADRNELTLSKNGKVKVITNDQIERIELYEQKSLGKFGKYDYMVIYIFDQQEILITDFTIPLLANDSIMMKFLRKKPRIHFCKRFNYIDETKFKPLFSN